MADNEKNISLTQDKDPIYELKGKAPIRRLVPFAIQQVLSMFVANMTPALLIASVAVYNGNSFTPVEVARILQCAMIVAGIGTFIQGFPIWRIGSGLPIIMGISFTFLSIGMTIAQDDYGYLVGAVIIGGLAEGILGFTYKYWQRFVTPLVSGVTVIAIGFSVVGSACNSLIESDIYEDGHIMNYLVGLITMFVAILLYLYGKGIVKQLYILIALVVGYALALILGMVDFPGISETINEMGVVSFPGILRFKPKFNIGYIISVILLYMTSAAETIGDTSVLAREGVKREPTEREISGSLCCDGLISSVAGLFGCTPITSFSGQIGITIMSGIMNRIWVMIAGVILIVTGLMPPVSALLSTIPSCVLGGISIIAFGSILISGIKMTYEAGLDERNTLIASVSLTLGIGTTLVEAAYSLMPKIIYDIFAGNPIAGVFVWAFILEIILPKKKVS